MTTLPSIADLLSEVTWLAEGTMAQRRQAWKSLSPDEVWPACSQAARAGEVETLLAALERCEKLPRYARLADILIPKWRIEVRCVAIVRLLTAAVIAGQAVRGAVPEELMAWMEWAVRDAPQPSGNERSSPGAFSPEAVIDEASRLLAPPEEQELLELRDAALQLLNDRPENPHRPVLARQRSALLLTVGESGLLGWLWGERVGGGTGALLQTPSAWLDPVTPDTREAILAAWELVQRKFPAPAGTDVRWWLGRLPAPRASGGEWSNSEEEPLELHGRSLQASAAILFRSLCSDRPCDAAVAVSAEVTDDGALRGVAGLSGTAPKLFAAQELAQQFGQATVVVSEENQPDPRMAAEWLSLGVRLRVARDLEQVWEIAAGGRAVPRGSDTPLPVPTNRNPHSLCRRLHFIGVGSAEGGGYAAAVQALVEKLRVRGYRVTTDAPSGSGLPWARETEAALAEADCVIAVLSEERRCSEVLEYQLQLAVDRWHAEGRPRILPLDLTASACPSPRAAAQLVSWRGVEWKPGASPESIAAELVRLLQAPTAPADPCRLAPPTGALPPDASTYVVRRCDDELAEALARGDAIIRLRGARQIGKTSLLARGLEQARKRGQTVLFTDFQALDAVCLGDTDRFYQALAQRLLPQVGETSGRTIHWDSLHGASWNLRQFLLGDLLARVPTHVVWAMDEVDLLFGRPHAGEFFGLVRSWHNERAASPSLSWSRLTVVLSYATEAHLTIPHTQSPFNVGTRISLEDLAPDQVADLNERYGAPVAGSREVERLHRYLGGQPYLTHRALHYLATRPASLAELEAVALTNNSPFADHLRRLLLLLAREEELKQGVLRALEGKLPEPGPFFRLTNAGVIAGEGPEPPRLRCELYARFFQRHLRD